jgi:hypothetical protein
MDMKKKLAMFLAGVMVVASLMGCGKAADSTPKAVDNVATAEKSLCIWGE